MLTKYKKYLQSYYNARVLAPADKYLPTLHTPYINLAMISRGRHDRGERDEFTLKTLHGGVDQILESKSPINIEDLLTPEYQGITPVYLQGGLTAAHMGVLTPAHPGGLTSYRLGSLTALHLAPSHLGSLTPSHLGGLTPAHLGGLTPEYQGDKGPYNREGLTHEHSHMPFSSRTYDTSFPASHEGYSLEHSLSLSVATAEGQRSGKPVRFILVEDPPGIGKSTFAWELCRRWDEIESLRDYHTVVLLKLREKWVLNATSLSDLFRYPSLPEFSRDVAREVHESHGQHLLLVLDGFDEVSHSFHEDSVINSILCKQLLPECTIILTTRPSAKATLESVCQPQVNKHVEIIGFTEEERVRYITEVFSKEPELQANFLKYMFLVPHIKSMMYIPLNCAIIAQVYSESQSSRHLAIPRTRTQLYKALAHSLLVRHMKMKEGNREYTSMLPEGLNEEHMERFRVLAKFAFDSYHKGDSKKVTFFKEDIPEGLVHFGFMNESTEMYAGKGVEQTFSFMHLSLQEYLAAWHIAHSYSIEFQVVYHGMAERASQSYRGSNREEEDLLSSLEPLGESVVEPAIFLAGITGWRCQSEDGRNHWEMYLSHVTGRVDGEEQGEGQEETNNTAGVSDPSVLLRSLYEAQNPTILSHYFNAGSSRREIDIGTSHTPYDCYALSYCLAHSSDQFTLVIYVSDDVSLVETFFKGLEDHCKPTSPPTVRYLRVEFEIDSVEGSNKCLFWLAKAKFLPKLEEIDFETTVLNSALAHTFLQSLVNLQSLVVQVDHHTSLEWLAALKSLRELKVLHICQDYFCSVTTEGLKEVVLDIELPSNSVYDVRSSTDALVDSLLKSVLRSNQITRMVLPNISRETMAGVHSILLHCPSLTSLELKRTRLGYDGILHICSALRNNTTLKHLVIEDDDLQVPPSRRPWKYGDIQFTSFLSMERVALPSKTTCTDFLLELDNILKTNTTLEEMKIQSGLLLPFSAGEGMEYCQWTGLGPLQQFNVRAVGSGRSPNLRRSFSSSDLTQPQTLLVWDRLLDVDRFVKLEVDFKNLFSLKKEKGQKLFSLPSFTAPDTEVLQSFSGLDPRLKECLKISYLNWYVERLRGSCWTMMRELSRYTRKHSASRAPRSSQY